MCANEFEVKPKSNIKYAQTLTLKILVIVQSE